MKRIFESLCRTMALLAVLALGSCFPYPISAPETQDTAPPQGDAPASPPEVAPGGGDVMASDTTLDAILPDVAPEYKAYPIENEWDLKEDVIVPEEQDWHVSLNVYSDRLEIVVDGTFDETAIAEGSILTGTIGGGFLREVTGIKGGGKEWTLYTVPAPLTAAIQDGGIQCTLGPIDPEEESLPVIPIDLSGEGTDKDYSDPDAYIYLHDTLLKFNITYPAVKLDIQITDGVVNYMRLRTFIDMKFDILFRVDSAGPNIIEADSFDWLDGFLPPVSFSDFIGPVPIQGAVTISPRFGFKVATAGETDVSVPLDGRIALITELVYMKGEWASYQDPSLIGAPKAPIGTMEGQVEVEIWGEAELEITFEGEAQPHLVTTRPGLAWHGQPSGGDICWSQVAFHQGTATVVAPWFAPGVPGFAAPEQLWEKKIGEGCVPSCETVCEKTTRCGPDGCGGACGNCDDDDEHCDNGQCESLTPCFDFVDGADCGFNFCGFFFGVCPVGSTCVENDCIPDP